MSVCVCTYIHTSYYHTSVSACNFPITCRTQPLATRGSSSSSTSWHVGGSGDALSLPAGLCVPTEAGSGDSGVSEGRGESLGGTEDDLVTGKLRGDKVMGFFIIGGVMREGDLGDRELLSALFSLSGVPLGDVLGSSPSSPLNRHTSSSFRRSSRLRKPSNEGLLFWSSRLDFVHSSRFLSCCMIRFPHGRLVFMLSGLAGTGGGTFFD